MTEVQISKGMEILSRVFEGFDREIPYVILTLCDQEFGIETRKIREVIKYVRPMSIPQASLNIIGILPLRGELVPVVDLRKIFGLDMGIDEFTVIMIVESEGKTLGLIADSANDFINMPESNIKPALGIKNPYVAAIAELAEKKVALLDIGRIINIGMNSHMKNETGTGLLSEIA